MPGSAVIPKEWTDTWQIFDENKNGYVSAGDFKHIVRALGRKYTELELNNALRDFGDSVKFDDFVAFMRRPYSGPTEEDLRAALKVFDAADEGMLKLDEISTLLSTLGEKMPEKEVQRLLADVKCDEDGRVSIDDFVKFLTTPVPLMTANIGELQKQLKEAEEL